MTRRPPRKARLCATAPMVAALLVAGLLGPACAGPDARIRIGSKSFTEQRILADILRLMVLDHGMDAEVIVCGDTLGCQQALRKGAIDLMVEYTGTGHLYVGGVFGQRPTMRELRERYRKWGLEWLDPLGFDNGYRAVMLRSRAAVLGIESIADLTRVDAGRIRVACPPTYLERPGDGLAALLRRHGLTEWGPPLAIEEVAGRVDALRNENADVAIVYATDGVLEDRSLVALDDSLGFFPPYEAAIVARSQVLANGELRATLSALSGQLDNATIKRLNYSAQVEGHSPEELALRFLRARELVGATPESTTSKALPLSLALAAGDRLEIYRERATRAVRQAFPERPVETSFVDDPEDALAHARARLAVVGAEAFFTREAGMPRRSTHLVAVAVLGSRVVHLVRRRDDDGAPLSGRVGIGPAESGGGRLAEAVLRVNDTVAATRDDEAILVDQVSRGDLDAALVVAEIDAPLLAPVLGEELVLRSLPKKPGGLAYPYLHPTRIPANTYKGQAEVVDTVGAQVLIAAPASSNANRPVVGPAAALQPAAAALTAKRARALANATGVHEVPDAVLPTPWNTWRLETDDAEADANRPEWLQTVLNLLALAFLGFLGYLLVRPGLGADLSKD